MHPAQGALSSTNRVISLNNASFEPESGKLLLTKRAGEEASFVATLFNLDQVGARKRRFIEDHGVPCVN